MAFRTETVPEPQRFGGESPGAPGFRFQPEAAGFTEDFGGFHNPDFTAKPQE